MDQAAAGPAGEPAFLDAEVADAEIDDEPRDEAARRRVAAWYARSAK
jgi:hypothetical protein